VARAGERLLRTHLKVGRLRFPSFRRNPPNRIKESWCSFGGKKKGGRAKCYKFEQGRGVGKTKKGGVAF